MLSNDRQLIVLTQKGVREETDTGGKRGHKQGVYRRGQVDSQTLSTDNWTHQSEDVSNNIKFTPHKEMMCSFM